MFPGDFFVSRGWRGFRRKYLATDYTNEHGLVYAFAQRILRDLREIFLSPAELADFAEDKLATDYTNEHGLISSVEICVIRGKNIFVAFK